MREFLVELYGEHLEEASFLYGQCRYLRNDAEMPWTGLAAFEQRLEAHLDALMVGGDLALEVCRQRATAGDAGELFAAISVGCRYGDSALLSHAWAALEGDKPDQTAAATYALQAGLPDTWNKRCMVSLQQGGGALTTALARVAGYRRLRSGSAWSRTLAQAVSNDERQSILWAMGRCADRGSAGWIEPMYRAPEAAVRAAALRAGLLLGDAFALDSAIDADAPGSSPIAQALGGGSRVVREILKELRGADSPPEAIVALGLLGDLSAVRPLVDLLEFQTTGDAAAQSLFVVTGAPMFEATFVPDAVPEDELLNDELMQLRRTGDLPIRSDGRPFGSTVTRLSREPAAWKDWMTRNARRFTAGKRYRFGVPCSPMVTLRGMLNELTPKPFRPLFLDELKIRHKIDLALEVDMPVSVQKLTLERFLESSLPELSNRAGGWHFGGVEVT